MRSGTHDEQPTHLWYRQEEDYDIQCHVDASERVRLSVDVDTLSWVLPVPSVPYEVDWVAVQSGRDNAGCTKKPNDHHEDTTLPLERFCSPDPEIEQEYGDLGEDDDECIQELFNKKVLNFCVSDTAPQFPQASYSQREYR